MPGAKVVSLLLVPALLTAGCGAASGEWSTVDPVARALGAALTRLAAEPGLRLAGGSGSGSLDLRVTGAGEAVGSLTQGARRAEVLVVDGATYVKAGKEYWAGPDGRSPAPSSGGTGR
jgi:hypothetical protein